MSGGAHGHADLDQHADDSLRAHHRWGYCHLPAPQDRRGHSTGWGNGSPGGAAKLGDLGTALPAPRIAILERFPSPAVWERETNEWPGLYLPNAVVTSSVSRYSVISCTLPLAIRKT